MRTKLAIAVLVLAATVVPAAGAAAHPASPPSNVRGAFFANWDRYARNYLVNQIPAGKLNVIDYAFAFATPSGCALSDVWSDFQAPTWGPEGSVDGVADDPSNPDQHLFGNFNQLVKLKAAHPDLRVEMSIGGWTGSTYFSDAAATPATRAAFVKSCIDLIIKGNLPTGGWPTQAGGTGAAAGLFDGINIDWEYPGPIPATVRITRRPTSTTRRCSCRSSGTNSTSRGPLQASTTRSPLRFRAATSTRRAAGSFRRLRRPSTGST